MKLLKRTLAMLLVLTMVLGMVPFAAFAEETTEGTEGTLPVPTHMNTKPADGTVTGQPFNDAESVSRNYRIPGLVNHNGTLIATADVRYNAEKDGGGIDIVVSRSADNGKNWNYTFPAYLGDNGNEYNGASSTIMDPLIISDGETLYLLYDLFSAGYSLGTWNTTYGFWATGTGFDSQGRLRLGTTYNGTEDSWNYYLENGQIKDSSGNAVAGYTVDAWFNVYQNGTYVSNLFFKDAPYMVYPTSYIAMQTSTNGGSNWSDPQLLNIKENGPTWEVLGPGTGLVTAKGELAFTTYDNTNIYLIHGKDNDWSIVKTPSATNESSIVELADGTIRAFVKNSGNTVSYVDFTPNGDSYTAGAAKSTGIPNTGWCMVSSLVYSRSIDGEDVILVCCPKGSNDGTRRFGTLHAFKADSMELVGSYQIDTGYTDQFFAYSDMAELDNGKLALIYEDGCGTYNSAPWNGSSAGSGYSHISYTEIDLEKELGLVFDEPKDVFNWGSDNDTVEVQVPRAAGVTHMHTRPAEVNNMNVAYSAYEIVLCKDAKNDCTEEFTCANVHTGTAIVELALTESLKAVDDVKGFVVEADGSITSVLDVENDGTHVTFEAPHFSVVGIAAMTDDEIAEKNAVDVTLKVGETETIYLKDVVYTDDDVTKAANADTVVVTSVVGNAVTTRELRPVTGIVSGKSYMLWNTRVSETLRNEPSANGRLYLNGTLNIDDPTAIWTITAVEGTENGYTVQDANGKYLSIPGNGQAGVIDTAKTLIIGANGTHDATGYTKWQIKDGGQYLNSHDAQNDAGGWYQDGDAGSQWVLYEVVESSTTISFTGKKVGQTQVTVGSTEYMITVEPSAVENLTLQIGENKTFTVDGVDYTDDDVTKAENADTVVLTSVDGNTVVHREVSTVPATELKPGAKYVIKTGRTDRQERTMIANPVKVNDSKYGIELVNSPSGDTMYWTIDAVDGGGYTISNGGQNVRIDGNNKATLAADAVVQIRVSQRNGYGNGYWEIYSAINGTNYYLNYFDSFGNASSSGCAAAVWQDNDSGSQWKLYEVTEETESSTEITFTGEAEGKTQVTVGATQYNITVVPADVRNITLHIGATETFIIEGYSYSMANATTKPNTAYATLKSVKAVPTLVPVTAIESGKQYLIVNKSTGDVLTDTVVSASGTWGARTGLNTTGKASANSAELWTITGADGSYTVAQNGKYLVVAGFHADMSADAANLTLAYTDSGWTIYDNTTYQALGHEGPGYYLSDKVDEANGYVYDAMGSSDEGNAARYWDIYEIDPHGATEVVFTGVAVGGPTTAVIGHVTFNITVVEPDPVELDITLYKDATATYVIEGLAYGDANVKLYPEETAAKLDSVTSKVIPGVKRLVQITSEDQIVSGKSYLIATGNNNSVLTSEAQTATALDIGSVASVNSTELWTFTGGNGVYTISPAENSYLNLADATGATVTGTAQSLTVEWLQNASAWTIAGTGTNKYLNNNANTNDLAATWSDNDAGSQWRLFEIVTEVPDRTITEVTFTGVTPGETTTAQVGHVTYNITVAEKDVRPITLYVGVTQNDFIDGYGYDNTQSTQPDNTYAYIHSVTAEDGNTKVVFSGVAKTPEGKVITATVGHVTYEITVKDLHSGEDVPGFNCVIGEGQYASGAGVTENLNGKEVKSLRISEGMVFNLGVDITDADTITWENIDPTIATVDETGKITAVSEGTTLIKATVTKNGVSETMAVHVTVVPSMVEGYSADEISHVVYYIDTVHMTDPYYTMFLSSENSAGPVAEHTMVMVSQAEVIVLQRPKNTAFAMVWTSDPWDNHALTYMAATGTKGEYYPLQSDNGVLETGTVNGIEYYKGCTAYNNIINAGNAAGASWRDAFDALLEYNVHVGEDIWQEFGCDGAMSMSRGSTDGHPNTATSLSFISEKLPEVSKTINGILGNSGKKSEWKLYQEGMYTEVGEHVYYNITVTQDAPHSWQRNQDGSFKYATDEDGNVLLDAEGNKLKLSALEYDMNAMLRDRLMDANDMPITLKNNPPYFYTKELDAEDGDQSGNGIANDDGYIADVTKQKNALDIHEDLNAGWTQAQIDAGSRTLTYYVVYRIQQEDFGQLLKNGVGLDYTYGSAYSHGSQATEASATATMRILGESLQDLVVDFGQPVSFTISGNQLTSEINLDNTKNAQGSLRYGDIAITQTVAEGTDSLSYNITYTPNKIMNGYDVVYLMNDNNELVNYFRVYPATTVYYEESFLLDNNNGWTRTSGTDAGNQAYETLERKENPYGYDPIYSNGLQGSAGSYISANQIGANTSFTFTGTGFDLYANCDSESGYVAITVRKNNADDSKTVVKLMTVNTKAKVGDTAATAGQSENQYHMPIVSVQDLDHATYTVEIRKIMQKERNVIIDGVRIYNTVADTSVFKENLEDAPKFFEMRDYVLTALDVSYSEQYDTVEGMASQIFGQLNADHDPTDGETPNVTAVVLANGANISRKIQVTNVSTQYADGGSSEQIIVTGIYTEYDAENTPVKESSKEIYNLTTYKTADKEIAIQENTSEVIQKEKATTEFDKVYMTTTTTTYANGGSSNEIVVEGTSGEETTEVFRTITYIDADGKVVVEANTSEVVSQNSVTTELKSGLESTTTAQDLLDNGPKNELFLYPGQSLVFNVTTSRMMQLGLKAPTNAATAYSLQYRYSTTDENGDETEVTETVADNAAMNTSVDMFYALGNENGTERTYTVTVTNDGDAILSVTKLKVCDDPDAKFVPLTVEDVEQILLAAGFTADEEAPADPSVPEESKPQETTPEETKPEETKPEATTPEETKPENTGCAKDDTCILSKFSDIVATEWYHDGVHFCVAEGLMNGMGEGIFAPNDPTTRAQLVTMLYRLMGNPKAEGKTEPFTDVAEGEWYYDAIVWAYSENVVKGISETEFAPNANVTREQVATILHRFLATPEGTGKLDSFSDAASVSDYAEDALVWAVGEGLINGVAQTDGKVFLDPTGTATRAQIATILYRYLENA